MWLSGLDAGGIHLITHELIFNQSNNLTPCGESARWPLYCFYNLNNKFRTFIFMSYGIYDLLIFDGFGIKPHSFFVLLLLKVLISPSFHFFTFLVEEHDKKTFISTGTRQTLKSSTLGGGKYDPFFENRIKKKQSHFGGVSG